MRLRFAITAFVRTLCCIISAAWPCPITRSISAATCEAATLQNIVVAAAGPAASMTLGLVFVAIIYSGGYYVPSPLPTIHQLDFLWHGQRISSVLLQGLLHAILFVNIVWALVNLLPVYPLDGGQISRELFTLGNPRLAFATLCSFPLPSAV